VPGSVKTEAIVLRSIRYGEADRILHLYSADRGRVNAIAKGSRRPKSRFGGRLEPFFRLDLMLHEGRGELLTVTGASTVAGHPNLRSSGPAIAAAAQACEAVLRLLDSSEPNRPAYNLLCRYLGMLEGEADPAIETPEPAPSSRAAALAFRLKLALAAGFVPELAACARCGTRDEISAFSGVAGGVVCSGCEGAGFRISEQAHEFMVAALGRPLAELPEAGESALRQVERATSDVLSHHAHVQLRAVA
jgi:DNA repair protein RecO (recombination protein O)